MGIKYEVNEQFFDGWSRTMAYVLGYVYADGSLEDAWYLRGKYLRVSSVERFTITKIRRWLGSKHTIIRLKSRKPTVRDRFLLRIGSHKLYNSLTQLGLFPNKSLVIKFPKVPARYLSDFIRGYFDGDGCVYLEMSKDKLRIKRIRVVFTSGSEVFLDKLHSSLRERHVVAGGRVFNGHRSFMLVYSSSDSIGMFKFLYKAVPPQLCLKRKFNKFCKYFTLRPNKVDKEVSRILNRTRYEA